VTPVPDPLPKECLGFDMMLMLKEVVHFFIIAITVVVVAMPEGLPLAVTISLAYSVMKMKQENNLVRKLDASETMGGADQICTDKTGTLTKNEMSVEGLWTGDTIYQKQNLSNMKLMDQPNAELLGQGVLYNCSARVEKNDLGNLEAKGNCTEQGLIRYLLKQKFPALERLETKNETLPDGTPRIIAQIPFNSKRKKATTAVLLPEGNDTVRIFVKGAPDFVLDLCDTFIGKSGQAEELTSEKKTEIMEYVIRDNFAKNAFRTLLIAYKDLSLTEFKNLKQRNNDFKDEKDREALEN
jgi:magnesium-transporting ATPase (P-type)